MQSSSAKRTVAETAKEIQRLLDKFEKISPTATDSEKIDYINAETRADFKKRVVAALKAGGEAVIDEFVLENKYMRICKAVLKVWLESSS